MIKDIILLCKTFKNCLITGLKFYIKNPIRPLPKGLNLYGSRYQTDLFN